MKKTSLNKLSNEVTKIFEEYSETTSEEVNDAVDTVAKHCVANIKNNIKTSGIHDNDYSRSWTSKVTENNSHSKVKTVYSKNRYQIAHLLENGHANRDGGRTKAFPHIAPAEQIAVDELEKLIKKRLQ